MPKTIPLCERNWEWVPGCKKPAYSEDAAEAEVLRIIRYLKQKRRVQLVLGQTRNWWVCVGHGSARNPAGHRSGSYKGKHHVYLWCKDAHEEVPNNLGYANFKSETTAVDYARACCFVQRPATSKPKPVCTSRDERAQKRSGGPVVAPATPDAPLKKKKLENATPPPLELVHPVVHGQMLCFGDDYPQLRVRQGDNPLSHAGWVRVARAMLYAHAADLAAVAAHGKTAAKDELCLTPGKTEDEDKEKDYFKSNSGMVAMSHSSNSPGTRFAHEISAALAIMAVLTFEMLRGRTEFEAFIVAQRVAGIDEVHRRQLAGVAGRVEGNRFVRSSAAEPMLDDLRDFATTMSAAYAAEFPAKFAAEMQLLAPIGYYGHQGKYQTMDPRDGLGDLAADTPYTGLSINLQRMAAGTRPASGCEALAYLVRQHTLLIPAFVFCMQIFACPVTFPVGWKPRQTFPVGCKPPHAASTAPAHGACAEVWARPAVRVLHQAEQLGVGSTLRHHQRHVEAAASERPRRPHGQGQQGGSWQHRHLHARDARLRGAPGWDVRRTARRQGW